MTMHEPTTSNGPAARLTSISREIDAHVYKTLTTATEGIVEHERTQE